MKFNIPERSDPFNGSNRTIAFWKNSDGYVLLVITNPSVQSNNKLRVYSISGVTSQGIGNGFLMAFDNDGKPLWDDIVEVKNTYFILNQPSDLPVILFGARAYSYITDEQGNTRTSNQTTWFSGIDRRTGRMVLDEDLGMSVSSGITVSANPVNDTMKIETRQITLDLAFTDDDPVPLEPSIFYSPPEGGVSEASDRPLGLAILEATGESIKDDLILPVLGPLSLGGLAEEIAEEIFREIERNF